jgi:hypothetical protein
MSHEEVWLHPSPRLASMRRVEVAAATGLVAIVVLAGLAAAAMTGIAGVAGLSGTGSLVLIGVLIAGFLVDRWAQRRVRAWAYRERDDDLMVQRGVMVSRLSVVPYGRMQFIDVVAGPIERAYGLATVRMHTAAAASDARIPGLSRDEADRLRDHLAELGEARAAGL